MEDESVMKIIVSCNPRQHQIMQQLRLISMISISTGSSSHTYTPGSFAHQLNKELDSIRNQRNKLGKYLYYLTGLIYFVSKPQIAMEMYAKEVSFFTYC